MIAWLSGRFASLRATPLGCLVEHFFAGLFRSSGDTGPSEYELSPSGLLGLLAVPGAFMAMSLFGKYSSLLRFIKGEKAFDIFTASLPDKYFFIVFSMVVTGVVAVLQWDRILPSRADYFNFAPLPLPLRSVFLANLAAILIAVAVFAVDVNLVSTVLFPLVVTADSGTGVGFTGFLAFIATHALCTILASLFTFFAFVAASGTLMMVLPAAAFAKVSLYLRVSALAALFAVLTTSFAVLPAVRGLATHPDSLVRWLPPVWFLGLYQWMQDRASAPLEALGMLALQATAFAFVAAMAVYTVSYRRYFLLIPESLESRPAASSERRSRIGAWLNRVLLPTGFQRACYHFGMKTLLRSETHCLVFGGITALGVVAAAQRAVRAAESGRLAMWLSLSFIVAYCVIVALRFVFEMPVGLRANVVFRSGLDPHAHEVGSVARKMIWTFLLPGVILPSLLIGAWAMGPLDGMLHAVMVTTACWVLMEGLLLRYRKIPFTCSMPPFQNDVIMVLFLYVLGFVAFALLLPGIEQALLADKRLMPLVPAMAAAAAYFSRQARGDTDHDRFLIYEDRPEAAVTVIRLAE